MNGETSLILALKIMILCQLWRTVHIAITILNLFFRVVFIHMRLYSTFMKAELLSICFSNTRSGLISILNSHKLVINHIYQFLVVLEAKSDIVKIFETDLSLRYIMEN